VPLLLVPMLPVTAAPPPGAAAGPVSVEAELEASTEALLGALPAAPVETPMVAPCPERLTEFCPSPTLSSLMSRSAAGPINAKFRQLSSQESTTTVWGSALAPESAAAGFKMIFAGGAETDFGSSGTSPVAAEAVCTISTVGPGGAGRF